jgi:hypothetical protein
MSGSRRCAPVLPGRNVNRFAYGKERTKGSKEELRRQALLCGAVCVGQVPRWVSGGALVRRAARPSGAGGARRFVCFSGGWHDG